MKIEGDVLTVNGMRELLQDLKCVCGLDWRKECAYILATEIHATLSKEPTYINGEAVYINKNSE